MKKSLLLSCLIALLMLPVSVTIGADSSDAASSSTTNEDAAPKVKVKRKPTSQGPTLSTESQSDATTLNAATSKTTTNESNNANKQAAAEKSATIKDIVAPPTNKAALSESAGLPYQPDRSLEVGPVAYIERNLTYLIGIALAIIIAVIALLIIRHKKNKATLMEAETGATATAAALSSELEEIGLAPPPEITIPATAALETFSIDTLPPQAPANPAPTPPPLETITVSPDPTSISNVKADTPSATLDNPMTSSASSAAPSPAPSNPPPPPIGV